MGGGRTLDDFLRDFGFYKFTEYYPIIYFNGVDYFELKDGVYWNGRKCTRVFFEDDFLCLECKDYIVRFDIKDYGWDRRDLKKIWVQAINGKYRGKWMAKQYIHKRRE